MVIDIDIQICHDYPILEGFSAYIVVPMICTKAKS